MISGTCDFSRAFRASFRVWAHWQEGFDAPTGMIRRVLVQGYLTATTQLPSRLTLQNPAYYYFHNISY
jgi:hypothetical protein